MEDVNVLNERFLAVQGLWVKGQIASAFEMLDGMYKEYSAMDWIEENVPADAEDMEQQQTLHYVYKEFYAHHLVSYYCQLFSALIPLVDEAVKYKDYIIEAYSHIDEILSELEDLEKAAPGEESRYRLWLERRDYKNVRIMLSDYYELPQCEISQEDYDDFLYSYKHQASFWDDDTDEDNMDDDDDDLSDVDYDEIDDYFYKRRWCNIHYYCLGVVKNNAKEGEINYRSVIEQLRHDTGLSIEEWQLKDDDERRVIKRLEEFVASTSIDCNSLPIMQNQGGKSYAPLLIEVVATLNYSELGTTCIGYVASGEVSVGDKVKLNFSLGNGEHLPEIDDNGMLSANITWIETNGKELTDKAMAGNTLSLGLDVERFLLPKTISSMEKYIPKENE